MPDNEKPRRCLSGGASNDDLGGTKIKDGPDNKDDPSAWQASDAHLLDLMELRIDCRYLARRCAIAHVRLEHGQLTNEEQDELLTKGDLLKRAIAAWSKR